MAGKGFRLQWKGAQTKEQVVRGVIGGLNEFHLGAETPIKAILQKGHGVVTGTARRSIHADAPTYTWGSDDVVPSPGTPERMGTGELPQKQANTVVGTIGSGLSYARALHDGHGSFSGYHFITLGYEKHQHELLPALEKHARLQGLK